MKRLFTLLFTISIGFHLFAQEYTLPLNENPEVKNYIKKNLSEKFNKNSDTTSMELPFWDDFSEQNIYPSPTYWTDRKAYINNTLALNPPTIGVATLDAVNAQGAIYENANYNTLFAADTLTSVPINLNYPGNTTIFLSFYYQPKGLGDAPEEQDSLFLEFYAPEENTWNRVWTTPGTNNTDFTFVIIPVDEEKYLKDNFQFRFGNYASFGAATYPSLATNCDFWNIDYVYLNKDRSIDDTVFKDLAFTAPLSSLLKDYTAAPWDHFKNANVQNLKDEIKVAFKNNDNETRLIDSLNFTLQDEDGTSANQFWFAGTYTPLAFQQSEILLSGHPFSFPGNNLSEADFLLSAKIVTNSYDPAQNNTVSYTQSFKNYYAYDDGSAEAGYGIYGNGTKYGQVALKFAPMKNDYLTGVNMYFTRAFEDASQKYFWIYIWEAAEDGTPGDTIATIEGIRPEYEDELNKFHRYVFEEPLFIEGDFFIGWTQTTEDKLNIGFDYNTINNKKTFYNISGDWMQSQIPGSLMIRPLFGTIANSISTTDIESLKVYPNPATDKINIELPHNIDKTQSIEITDIQGKRFYAKQQIHSNSLDISRLPKGIYLIKITDNSSKRIFMSKFVKI